MSAAYAFRWRPQIYRSTTEAVVVNRSPGDAEADPPVPASSGQRVEVLQAVVYDDAVLGATVPYQPGDPATEQLLRIAIETPVMLEVSAFAGKTPTQAQALWDAARDAQIAQWQAMPDAMALINAAIGAALSPMVVPT